MYFSKGQYFWFEFVVQSFRVSDYRFGGFLWEHEPNRFRINLMFADKNLLVPDTSCSCRVDRWGGCNMMMPPWLARLTQNELWNKDVSWWGDSHALIFIEIGLLFLVLLQICHQKTLSFRTSRKRNSLQFDRLVDDLNEILSPFIHWWKHWHMPSGIDGVRYLRAIGYFSISQCATGPPRERKVCPRRSRM